MLHELVEDVKRFALIAKSQYLIAEEVFACNFEEIRLSIEGVSLARVVGTEVNSIATNTDGCMSAKSAGPTVTYESHPWCFCCRTFR